MTTVTVTAINTYGDHLDERTVTASQARRSLVAMIRRVCATIAPDDIAMLTALQLAARWTPADGDFRQSVPTWNRTHSVVFTADGAR